MITLVLVLKVKGESRKGQTRKVWLKEHSRILEHCGTHPSKDGIFHVESNSGVFYSMNSEDNVPKKGMLGIWEAKDRRSLRLGPLTEIAVNTGEPGTTL